MTRPPDSPQLEFWFVTGSQHLYGPEALEQVANNARTVVAALNDSGDLPHPLVFKPVLTTPDQVTRLCLDATADDNCAGVVAWMHTFSPAKMWISGLQQLGKPLADLHTQFGRDIPWKSIDMDFMNLHQTAHGGREFGHIGARLRMPRLRTIQNRHGNQRPRSRPRPLTGQNLRQELLQPLALRR